jgi:predicted PhzF superfamily epimerase YddE/YHI9
LRDHRQICGVKEALVSSRRRTLPFHIVDVFAVEPLTGNPLAVVVGGEDLTLDLLRRIAREFNQSETTFLMKPARAHLVAHGLAPSGQPMLIEQGTAMGRTSLIRAEVVANSVKVSGRGVVVASGELTL